MDVTRALSRIAAFAGLAGRRAGVGEKNAPAEAEVQRGGAWERGVTAALGSPIAPGASWAPLSYGEYYPRSVLVYSAIKARQDAVARVPLRVYEDAPGPRRGPARTLQRLLDSPNPLWTSADLWRATETYLGLWGSAYWGLERGPQGRVLRDVAAAARPGARRPRLGAPCQGLRLHRPRPASSSPTSPRTCSGSATSTPWRSTPASRRSPRSGCPPTWASTRSAPTGAA